MAVDQVKPEREPLRLARSELESALAASACLVGALVLAIVVLATRACT